MESLEALLHQHMTQVREQWECNERKRERRMDEGREGRIGRVAMCDKWKIRFLKRKKKVLLCAAPYSMPQYIEIKAQTIAH